MYTDEFRAVERGPWPGPMTGRRAGRSFVHQGPVPASEDVRPREWGPGPDAMLRSWNRSI